MKMKSKVPIYEVKTSTNHEPESTEVPVVRIKHCVIEPKEKKKMYSLRLKIKTVETIKRMSANIGVPYQTYVNAILDDVAKLG